VQTEQDEDEIIYGNWEFTAQDVLEEERKLFAAKKPKDIWPRWSDGVPAKLRRTYYCPSFTKNGVRYKSRQHCETLEFWWTSPRTISELGKNYGQLPSTRKYHWSGVYRIFILDTAIERLCGKDPTGTLYLGLAGTGSRSWSILRNRLMGVANGDHHAIREWRCNDALTAENWLLHCYRDTFGEFPPLNEKA
jgi:hypothetical protein